MPPLGIKRRAPTSPKTPSSIIEPSSLNHNLQDHEDMVDWKLTQFFDPAQIQLIVTLLENKPDHKSLEEYISSLAEAIKPQSERSKRFVDSGEHWKSNYESLHRHSLILERRNRVLEEKLRLSTDDDPRILQNASRMVAENLRLLDDNIVEAPGSIPDQHLMASSYLFQLSQLRTSLDNAPSDLFNLETGQALCRKLLKLCEEAVLKTTLELRHLMTTSHDRTSILLLRYLLAEVVSAYIFCFRTLDENCKTIGGRNAMKTSDLPVILSSFFQQCLKHLHIVSGLVAKDQTTRPDLSSITVDGEFTVNKLMTRMLEAILREIPWDAHKVHHKTLLESIMGSVLASAGSLASQSIFFEDVSASNAPSNISLGGPNPLTPNEIKHESRYLISILQAVLQVEEKHNMMAKKSLRSKAQIHLQRILRHSIIGKNLKTMDHQPLPKVVDEPIDNPVLNQHEKYGAEWLLEALWLLIPWECNEEE